MELFKIIFLILGTFSFIVIVSIRGVGSTKSLNSKKLGRLSLCFFMLIVIAVVILSGLMFLEDCGFIDLDKIEKSIKRIFYRYFY